MAKEERSEEQLAELASYYRTIAPLLSDTHKELDELLKAQNKIGGPRAILVSQTLNKPRMVRILPRGKLVG